MKAWVRFIGVQLLHTAATLLGFVMLAPACFFLAWDQWPTAKSLKDNRTIDAWQWPINAVYGNPEDGVSGKYAIVNGQPYMPNADPRWRAYCWSAARNSADGLKYLTAWPAGTMLFSKYYTLFGRQHHAKGGWQNENGFNVPVLRFW